MMREYIYSLMTDKAGGAGATLMKAVLYAASIFYRLSVDLIRIFKTIFSKRLDCKVVSVGNLTLGGTGKTPAVIALADILKKEGRNPAVIIRGYGDDEWRMLSEKLKGVPVIVNKNRLAGGRKAVREFGADTALFDDGFQHWAVKRDLDIVLIDSTNPFGNRRIFPRGVLREPISSVKRADIILLTKTDMGRENIPGITDEIKRFAGGACVLESIHAPRDFYEIKTGARVALSEIDGSKVAVLSSIENKEYFEYTLRALGASIAARFGYPDHYDYAGSDIEGIIQKCGGSKIETIVTTEKDAAKLKPWMFKGGILVLVLRVELKVTDGEEILKERLRGLYSV